jgi:hypothetical protein
MHRRDDFKARALCILAREAKMSHNVTCLKLHGLFFCFYIFTGQSTDIRP